MALPCIKCKGLLNFILQGRSIRLQSDGDITIWPTNQRRTELYEGEFTLEKRNPRIEVIVVVPIDTYVKDIQELCNVPVVVELCDGRTFSTDHASQISDAGYDAKRNLQTVHLICDEITELLPVAA